MPGIGLRIEGNNPDEVAVPAEEIALWLPSALTRVECENICQQGVSEMEEKLRESQCYDCLDRLRNMLRTKDHFIRHKNLNVRSQRRTTRALGLIDRVKARITIAATKYNAARAALLSLRGPGEWEKILQVLDNKDLRDPSAAELSIEDPTSTIGPDGRPVPKRILAERAKRLGEGRRLISWIWMSGVSNEQTTDAEELNNGTYSSISVHDHH